MDKTGWRAEFIRAKNGVLKPLFANAVIALRGAQCWQGVLAFDVFAHQTMLNDVPPWEPWIGAANFEPRPWTEQDDLALTHWLQTVEAIAVTPAVAAQAVELVARDRSYHPVRDYLNSLEHDGVFRLDTMLSTYFGAEQSEYTKMVGRNVMISAIARILGYSEKVDTMMILEGPQGLLKSTAVKVLFYPWFTDDIEQFGSKDASMQCAGVWCIEIGELDAMSKTEASRIKAFISRTDDRFRPPYGRRIIERPRSCIFIGTTNCNDYLKDWTGARRFLPVSVTQVDIEGLQRDRDMLWAEARILYEAGVAWWFTDTETGKAAAAKAEQEQEARYQAEAWEPLIADYLDSRLHRPPAHPAYRVVIEHVFKNAIGLDEVNWDQAAMNRVARCLKRLGWTRKQVTIETTVQGKPQDKRVWMYVRAPTEDELVQDARQEEIDGRKKAAETEPGSNVTTLKQPAPVVADTAVMQETAVPQG
ncbi:virulence-associated E family protein [Bradyrhizobium manausense]|uniref:virulence-associated E family protein n=1 Tax=Bradyrhizobium manausense TaxID=989370 RepID=UPI001BAC5433|nr:virulence-associated E family protein [Bradyrhizobium manausense]MBR0792163.1 virulence-associated E family protein [Bradyrhizobium manausense]